MAPQAGDTDGLDADLGAIYESQVGPLTVYCRSRGVARDDVEDVVDDVFARFVTSVRRERRVIEYPEAWLFATASHVVADFFRRSVKATDDEGLEEVVAPDAWRKLEDEEAVSRTVEALPEPLREPVLLRLEGRGHIEIGTRLGITRNAVGLRLLRARDLLRSHIQLRRAERRRRLC